MRIKPLLIAAALAALAFPAWAAAPHGTPIHVRGTIAKLAGHVLAVKEHNGSTVDVALAAHTAVETLVRRKLSDIKPGDYVGATSMRGTDGKLHAIEIHFLPAAAPQGQFPWDLRQGSIMTNAHVSGVAKARGGESLTVSYKGGTSDILVGPHTVIVSAVKGSVRDLKRGKAVFLRAVKAPDGAVSANNVIVQKDGVKPPM